MKVLPRPVVVGGALLAWMVLAALAMGVLVDGPGLKLPVLLESTVYGLANALLAVGIVLVYRATRVIDFAHAAFGVVGAALFFELVQYVGVPYWLALPAGVLAAGAIAALVEVLIVRRFARSPRLIVTVATIGIAQLLTGFAGLLPGLMGDVRFRPGIPRTPFSGMRRELFPIVFNGNHVVLAVVGIVALVALAIFLSRSRLGMAVRGAAENEDRARLLGVNTSNVSTLVWGVGGLLAGLAVVLQVPITGYQGPEAGVAIGSGGLLLVLAAAVIGGMDDIPVAAAAAIGLTTLQQVTFFVTGQTNVGNAVLLVVIIAAFVLRRRRLQRTDESATSSWSATEEIRPVPRELARLHIVRTAGRRVLAVLAIAVLGYPLIASPTQVDLGSLYVLNGVVMISLVVLTGWGGQISLGQYGFVAVGAIVTGKLASFGIPFFFSLLGGAVAGMAVAIVLGLTALRVRGLYLAVTTLVFAVAMATVMLDPSVSGDFLPGSVERPVLLWLQTEDERVFYYLSLAVLGLVWWGALGLRRSRTARALIALRENERAAEVYGINVVRARLATFAMSGFIAAIAGGLLAAHQHSVSASYLGADKSIHIFLGAVIGGLGSIQGAVLGALYIGGVSLVVPGAVGQLLANSLGVLMILLFFPSGLGGMVYAARDAVLRRIAIRRRIAVPSLFGNRADHTFERAAIAPVPRADAGTSSEVPARYQLPSRIRVAGASQRERVWQL